MVPLVLAFVFGSLGCVLCTLAWLGWCYREKPYASLTEVLIIQNDPPGPPRGQPPLGSP